MKKQQFKKGEQVFFYVKRFRCWMKGIVTKECEYDEDLECNCYSLKDETGSNWAVQDGLLTQDFKKGMRVFNPKTFTFYNA